MEILTAFLFMLNTYWSSAALVIFMKFELVKGCTAPPLSYNQSIHLKHVKPILSVFTMVLFILQFLWAIHLSRYCSPSLMISIPRLKSRAFYNTSHPIHHWVFRRELLTSISVFSIIKTFSGSKKSLQSTLTEA